MLEILKKVVLSSWCVCALLICAPTPALAQTISPTGWTLKFVDSQETSCTNNAATKGFDGLSSTFWHTQFCNGSPAPPHEIQIDLGQYYTLTQFGYLPRQDGCSNGWIKGYEFYVSTDGVNWGTPVASGNFNYTGYTSGTSTPTSCTGASLVPVRSVTFPSTLGRYVRLRGITEVNGNNWISMAELSLMGTLYTGDLPPRGTITSPTGNVTIAPGQTINFMGSGTDLDGTVQGYHWTFGGAASDSFTQNPSVTFNTLGTYMVTLIVTDNQGVSDPNPPTLTVTVSNNTQTTISTSAWTLMFVDSQETSCTNNAATKGFDGLSSTFWHTGFCNGVAPLPHAIQIDLHGKYYIGALQYLPRQDGCSNGWINQFGFDVSMDGSNWSPLTGLGASNWTTAASGSFDYSGYTSGTSTPTSCTGASAVPARQVSIAPILGRYIQLRALSEINGNRYTSAAEIGVVSGCATTPSVLLNQPVSEYLQTTSTLTASATVCLGSQQAGWGAQFTLDGGSPVNVYSAPYQATFTGVSKAEHTVDVYLVDGSGNRITGSGAHDQATQVAVGDYYVGYGESVVYGTGDDIASDNTSSDGRDTGGGYTPILNNLLTSRKGYPQNVANEGLPGKDSSDGATYIQRLIARNPSAQMVLVMFGTNDSNASNVGRPSGLNLSPGQQGYAGSFKDDMQQIINAVVGAGKAIALAKNLPVLDSCGGTCTTYNPNSTRNQLIQQYNQVIDQLVSANHITVTPPDCYTFFANNWQTMYADTLHPNGVGYQNMAQLWANVLP
jgi:lysophospholipase L1-like esterase